MKGLGIILIIIGIFVVMGIVRDGTEGFKSKPIQSVWDSSKSIVNTGKDIVDKFKGGEENITSGLIEVGQIPCATDADCNLITECQPNYTCVCRDSSCWKEI